MKRRSKEQWQELFAQQDTSGLSAAAFCEQHGLCPRYFSLRRKYLAKAANKVEGGFVRAQVKPDTAREVSSAMARLLVIHTNAGRLDFNTLPPPHWLVQLLKGLA